MVYLLPQEIEVWYVIPSLRKELSKILTKKYGMTFEKAGNSLGVSKAAVSQYLSKKRGKQIKFSKATLKELQVSAKNIHDNPEKGFHEIFRLLKVSRANGDSCKVCEKFNKGAMHSCNHECRDDARKDLK